MTSSFINNLAEHIKANYNLQKEELTVVFPNKRAAYFLRSQFKEIYHENIWLPQILSIEEAMTQWSGYQLVDKVDMLFELIAINSERVGKGGNIGLFGSMAAQMAKDFDEIDQYNIDASYLFSYVYQNQKLGEWNFDSSATQKETAHLAFFKELEQYYNQLRERLEQQGKGYYGMMTRRLASLDDNQILERTHQRKIIFAGFNALTPTEQTVIDKLHRNGCAEIIWDFDQYYVNDENNQAGHFARLYHNQKRQWEPVNIPDNLLKNKIEIHLIGAEGNSLQTKALQSLLQVKDEKDAAIILADENLLVPVLNSIPDDPRFNSLKVSMGYPLRQTSIHHLICDYFTLHRKGLKVKNERWYLWPILRIFDLELVQVLFNDKELGELNKYRAFVAEKTAFVFNENDFRQCCPSPHLGKFVELLLHESNHHPSELLNALVELLSFIANQIQAHNPSERGIFLLNQVSEAGKCVNRLNNIVTHYRDYVSSIADLEVLYRLVSSNTNIKLNSKERGGLQIMGLLEARNLDFKTFYMLGVNEGILPSDSTQSSFIPYFIRKECGLPDEQDKQAVYAYHFYRLLQGAEKAYFIYNSNPGNSGGEPSRFLLQLKYALAKPENNPKATVIQEVFSAPTISNNQPERIIVHKTEELMDIVMQKIQTSNPTKALAPTSISSYIKCPLQFCFRYLLKIKDNSAEENTPANVIGSVVHETLQKLYDGLCDSVITPELFAGRIRPSMKATKEQAIKEEFVHGLPDVGYNYLNQLIVDKMLDNYLAYEEEDVANHEIKIMALEHTLSTTIEVDGITCAIAGKADRIDRRDGVVRIVDYKTGLLKDTDVKIPKTFDDLLEIPEKAMQLLIYKYLYMKEHHIQDVTKVTASLFGLRQKQVCLELNVENDSLNNAFVDTMEALLKEVLSSLMDRTKHFEQPDATSKRPCKYCDYNGICVSTLTGARLEDDH